MDYRIVVYVVPNTRRETIQTWGEIATQTGVDWPPDQLYLGLHDFSSANIVLSPLAYQWANHMTRETAHLEGYFAGAVPKTPTAIFLENLLNNNLLPRVPSLNMRIFFSRNEGLQWLASLLD